MVGDGAIVDNVLVSEAYSPQPPFLITRLGSTSKTATGACVAVEQRSSLRSLFFLARSVTGSRTTRNTRLVASSLRFAGNQIRQSTSSREDIDQSLPVIVSVRASDADFTHNVVEALLSRGDARTNVLIAASTARIVSNRMGEAACSTEYSLEVRASGHASVKDNQADHKVRITQQDGTTVTVDSSNASELASCAPPEVSVASKFLAELFAGAFAVGELAQVPDEANEVTGAYLGFLAARRDSNLAEWQADAARKVVRSVSSLELVKEILEEGGVVAPDLTSYRPLRNVAELGETYREVTEIAENVRPGVFEAAPVLGTTVRTLEGAPVEGARLVIETDGGIAEEIEARHGGRIEGGRLANALERVRTAGGAGAVRYRVESAAGELLDEGVIADSAIGRASVLDLTVSRRPRLEE